MRYSYNEAHSRNLGWTTEWEQAALRAKRVAIAGLGGVGGSHLLTLTRLGIGSFSIADFDTFDVVNLNRQAGANVGSLGRPKVDVLAEMALAINPGLAIDRFPDGVRLEAIDEFLAGSDLFVDGLDFFALDIRARVFERCAELGIPAVTAAPIGMGVGFLAFRPGGQTFEQYFRLSGVSEPEGYLRFLLGVAPAGLHRAYLVDDTRVDLARRRGPSTAAACELCAGMVATQALKILLGRGGVPYAPTHVTFDAYRGRLRIARLRWGNAGPVQRLKLGVARRVYAGMAARAPMATPEQYPRSVLHEIIETARWAPSGDNTQPWRFDVIEDDRVIIHVTSEAGSNPYEYRDGEPTFLAAGMLLESLSIAASAYHRELSWSVKTLQPLTIEVVFVVRDHVKASPMLAALPMRTVERRAMAWGRLSEADKEALGSALGPNLAVSWHERVRDRLAWSRLGAMASDIRLRAPETYTVHRKVVDWERRMSPDGLPAAALGLSRPMLFMMRWAMASWDRMARLNSLVGTSGAAVQLDWLPGLRSAAFFSIRSAGSVGADAEALLSVGRALQRFWLTATVRGLALQPALATLIFADYGAKRIPFTSDVTLLDRAACLSMRLSRLVGPLSSLHFAGRVGRRKLGLPRSRSVRQPTADLMVSSSTSP